MNKCRMIDDNALVRIVLGNPSVRQACEFLVLMMAEHKEKYGDPSGRYHISVNGRDVRASVERNFAASTLPPPEV